MTGSGAQTQPEWLLKLADRVELTYENGQMVRLVGPESSLDLHELTVSARGLLADLVVGMSEGEATAIADQEARMSARALIVGLQRAGWLDRVMLLGDRSVLRIEVVGRPYRPSLRGAPRSGSWRLHRFAFLRRDDRAQPGGAMVVESPQAMSRVVLLDPAAAAVVAALGTDREVSASFDIAGLSPEVAEAVALTLYREGFVRRSEPPEPDNEREWEFHDLLFHTRTRSGRHREPYGSTYPFEGVRPPTPALAGHDPDAEMLPLPRPNLADLMTQDPPLSAVMEQRRSWRQPGPTPLTAAQLGEFLFRTARVRDVFGGNRGEVTDRSYPGGGAAYELEIYLAVNRVSGVSRGLYRYDPLKHALVTVAPWSEKLAEVITNTARSAPPGLPADVTLLLTARMQRLTYKYAGVSYAVALKDLGVLLEAFYLAATAMGLSGCAVGGGECDALARLTETDTLREPHIGEFLLSSRDPAEIPAFQALRAELTERDVAHLGKS